MLPIPMSMHLWVCSHISFLIMDCLQYLLCIDKPGTKHAFTTTVACVRTYLVRWQTECQQCTDRNVCLQDDSSDTEAGRPGMHDSGSSLAPTSSSGAAGQHEAAAATKCWDIDASDIALCHHADGTEWLLSSTESGQVWGHALLHAVTVSERPNPNKEAVCLIFGLNEHCSHSSLMCICAEQYKSQHMHRCCMLL